MLTIEKIGGTSMSQFDKVLANVILNKRNFIQKDNPYNRIFVISAYSNVTNLLLEDKKNFKDGLYHHFIKNKNFDRELKKTENYLLELNKKLQPLNLDLIKANNFIKQRIKMVKGLLANLRQLLSSGYILKKNLYAVAREIIASIGESHSTFNSNNILTNHGYNAIFLDLSGFNDKKNLTIDERLEYRFKQVNIKENIVFVTGYIKGIDGIMRKFERGYSDITFSKIAVTLKNKFRCKIKEAIIYKEFHLSSADPNIVGERNAFPVGYTNYDVADQLADVGMEAIHPLASKPLERNNINLRIKNTFESNHQGTLITKKFIGRKAKIEIITGTKKVLLIEIHDPEMVGKIGFDKDIAEIFFKFQISYIFKSTNANSISQIIWEKEYSNNLFSTLKEKYFKVTIQKVAMVSVIGTNISIPGILAKTTKILSDCHINIKCVSQSLRQVNMQFIIDRKDYNPAILHLNKFLIKE